MCSSFKWPRDSEARFLQVCKGLETRKQGFLERLGALKLRNESLGFWRLIINIFPGGSRVLGTQKRGFLLVVRVFKDLEAQR